MDDFSDWTDDDILLDSLLSKKRHLQLARDEGTISRHVIVHMLSVNENQIDWAVSGIDISDAWTKTKR